MMRQADGLNDSWCDAYHRDAAAQPADLRLE
jgi:hypothetical protein